MLFAIEVNSVTPMPDERINQDNPLNIIMFSFTNQASAKYEKDFFDFKIEGISGDLIDLNEFKGDKISIGYTKKSYPIEFTNHETNLSDNTNFYIFSDGITDQVGGSKNLMYGKKRLLKHINHSNTIKNVFENITKDFSDYEKHNKRRDDLSLFGFSIA